MEFTPSRFAEELRKTLSLDTSEIARIIEEDIKQHIDDSKSIDEKPYPPLKASTIAGKSRRGDRNMRPIVGIKDSIEVKASADSIEINVNADYASYLQDKYNYIGISEKAIVEIDKYVQRRINAMLGD